MKILIHTDEYYPTPQACAYRMKVLADAFSAAGNDVTVIASAVNRANRIRRPCRAYHLRARPACEKKQRFCVC